MFTRSFGPPISGHLGSHGRFKRPWQRVYEDPPARGTYDKDHGILASILGPSMYGNPQMEARALTRRRGTRWLAIRL